MTKQVDFDRDIMPFIDVARGVYEKANIYEGYKNLKEFKYIYIKEYGEVLNEMDKLMDATKEMKKKNIVLKEELLEIRQIAFRLLLETLQVVAVCNKGLQMLEREEK